MLKTVNWARRSYGVIIVEADEMYTPETTIQQSRDTLIAAGYHFFPRCVRRSDLFVNAALHDRAVEHCSGVHLDVPHPPESRTSIKRAHDDGMRMAIAQTSVAARVNYNNTSGTYHL